MAKYISKFTGQEIDQRLENVVEKFSDAYFDSVTSQQYLFKSTDDKLAWLSGDTTIEYKTCAFEFSGTINKMTVVNYNDSKNLYYTQMSESAVITVGFKSEEKGITDTSWSEVMEDAHLTVEVDRGLTGKYNTVVNEQLVLNGNTFSADVIKYIATGNNRVRITAVGVDTGATSNIVYSVLLTSMYLSPANFKWATPFIEGQAFSLGGLYIGGNIDKVLKIKVSNEQTYSKLYEINIGTQTNTSIAYYYNGLEFPTEGTGVYNVEMWLDANGLESEHLHYNIMCIATVDVNTAQLIAVSNVLPTVKNYDTNKLFSYAVYNGGAQSASPVINVSAIINNTPTVIVKDAILKDIATATALDYIIDLEVDTQEANIQLYSSIELGESKQEVVYAIDNSASFPAVKNAVFYLNPANRNNSQENKTIIINESNLSNTEATYNTTWTNVSFVDGMDGWTVDNQGRKCLRLPATSKVSIDYAPFLNQNTLTLDISYRVENAANYDEDVITIASELTSKFIGVRVKPTNVLLHSNALRDNDLMQGYNTKDEEFVHLIVTIIQNYKGIGNLAQIYVNGVKKCSFEWVAGDTFSHGGTIDIGSDTADLFIYKMYVYHEAFDWIMSAQNFTASLPDTASKKAAHAKMQSVINDGNKIDFDKVKNGGYNYFTLRLPDGAKLPSTLSQSSVPHTRLEINIQQNPLFAINGIYDDEETEGQGTTAMNYFRWNLRWKTEIIRITAKKNFASSMHSNKMGGTALFNDLNRMIVGANEANARVAVEQYGAYGFLEVLKEGTTDQYERIFIGLYTIGQDKGDKTTFGYNNPAYKETVIHLEGTDHSPKAVGMDYPWAKLGVATNSDGDTNLGVRNADGSVVAAWEIGACGKAKTDADMLTYLTQEFKPAYDLDYLNTAMLVGLEAGTSIDAVNTNLSTFRAIETDLGYTNADCLIWIDGEYDTYYYDELEKKYVKDGVNLLTDLGISASDLTGTNVHEKNFEIRALRKARYREQMENAWHLRDNLFHYCFIVLFAATDNFKKNTYPYKFGTLASGSRWRWRQDDLDTLFDINNQGLANKIYSLMNGDKSGTTHLFRGNTSYHWTNIQFYYENEIKSMMLEILTAMASLSDTGDSLIERAVGCIRKYFWNKAQDYFSKSAYNLDAEWSYEEAWAAMKNGTYKAPVHPLQQSLGSHYEAQRAFVELRFVFMASLYGFGAFGVGNDSDTSLGQISFRPAQGGNTFHLTPAINMNPTILVGDSDRKTADGRLLAGETAEITVATDGDTSIYIQGTDYLSDIGDFSKVNLYAENPALTVQSKRLQKLKVGDEVADNVTTILKDLSILDCPSLSEVDARNVNTLTGTVDLSQCPRLKKALFGGTNVGIISLQKGSKIEEFELPDSLTNLSLVNLPNLGKGLPKDEEGVLDVTDYNTGYLKNNYSVGDKYIEAFTSHPTFRSKKVICAGYDELLISGTGAVAARLWSFVGNNDIVISVAEEQSVARNLRLSIPRNAKYVILNFDYGVDSTIFAQLIDKYHYGLNYNNLTALTYLRVENNANIEGYGLLKATYEDGAPLTNIRIVGFDYDGTSDDVALLAKLASGGYFGIDANGENNYNIIPVIEGTLNIAGSVYEEDANAVKSAYGTNLVLNVTGGYYMRFADPEVLKVLLANGVGDGMGVTEEQAAKVTNISLWFQNNTTIETFNELEKFTGITKLNNNSEQGGEFQGCSSLTSIVLPPKVTTLNFSCFNGLSNLKNLVLPESITTIGGRVFIGCGMENDIYLPNLIQVSSSTDQNSFMNSKIRRILSLGKITTIPSGSTGTGNGVFKDCVNLMEVHLPDTLVTIGALAFQGDTSLTTIEYDWSSLKTLGKNAFYNCTSLEIEDLSLPNLTSLGQNAFYKVKIKKMNISKVTALPSAAYESQNFGDKSVLEDVVLSDGLTKIPEYSFYNYTNLEIDAETLPKSITSIGIAAFLGTKLYGVINLPNLTGAISFGAFRDTKITHIESLGSVTQFNNSGANVGTPFQNCTSLVSISQNVWDNLTVLHTGAFAGCSNLVIDELKIPNLVSIVSNNEAMSSPKIRSILDLGKITSIGAYGMYNGPFQNNKTIEKVVLPETLAALNGGFHFFGCSSLNTIICKAVTPPTLGGFSVPSTFLIYVPDGSVEQEVDNGDGTTSTVTKTIVELYKEASGWSAYADRIRPLSEYDVRILTYNEDGEGGYKLYQIANYDTAKNDYVMGVAVKTQEHSFVIALKSTSSARFGWYTTQYSDTTLYNGREATNAMLQNSGETAIAHKANAYVFANGTTGYIGSSAECAIAYSHLEYINSALNKVGGSAWTSESWTSTSYSNNGAFAYIFRSTGMGGQDKSVARGCRPLTELPEGLEW